MDFTPSGHASISLPTDTYTMPVSAHEFQCNGHTFAGEKETERAAAPDSNI